MCVKQAVKCEAKEKRCPKTPMEAIAKTRKPAESCDGEKIAKRAAYSEGETSASKKLSTEEWVPTSIQAAKIPPTTNSSKKARIQAALARLIEVQQLENEIALKEFELKMANLKHKQERIMLQIEEAKRSKRSFANSSSNVKQSARWQQQCNVAANVCEVVERVRIGTVPANPAAVAIVEATARTEQHASAQPPSQPQNCSAANARTQLGCETRDNTLPHETVQSGGAEPLTNIYALRSMVPRVPFRIVSARNQQGQQAIETISTLQEEPATTPVQSILARSAGETGKPEPPEISFTAGATRDGSSVSKEGSANATGGENRQYEFANTRSSIKLSWPPQELFFTSLMNPFAHFQGLWIPPFLKGEPKLMIETIHTDLTAQPEIGSTGVPASDRSRLRWSGYSFGSFVGATFRQKLMRCFNNGVQFLRTTTLKEKNAQISERTHTLTDTNRSRVMYTPCALQDRCTDQMNVWFCIQQAIGRENRRKVTPLVDRRRLIAGLIVGMRNRMNKKYERHKARVENEERLPTTQLLYWQDREVAVYKRTLMRYLKSYRKPKICTSCRI